MPTRPRLTGGTRECESGHLEEGRRVSLGAAPEGQHDGVVHGILAGAADAGIGRPEQRMPPIECLEQRLNEPKPEVSAPEMEQFVQQHRPQLVGGKLLGQSARQQDDRGKQAADRR